MSDRPNMAGPSTRDGRRGMAFLLRWAVLVTSGCSLAMCAGLIHAASRHANLRTEWDIRSERAANGRHELVVWRVTLDHALLVSRGTFAEEGLTDEQVAVLRGDIGRRRTIEVIETSIGPNAEREPLGPFHDTWPSGGVERGVRVTVGFAIALTAALPAFLLLRGTARLVSRLRRPRGPARPLGYRWTIAAFGSLLLSLTVSAAWMQSQIGGFVAQQTFGPSDARAALSHHDCIQLVSFPGYLHVCAAHGDAACKAVPWDQSQTDAGDDLNASVGSIVDPSSEAVRPRHNIRWGHPPEDFVLSDAFSGLFGGPDFSERWAGRAPISLEWRRLAPGARGSGNGFICEAIISYWLLWAITASLPLSWLARRRGWIGRRAAGVCPGCGYDLRASTVRCPECGIPIRGPSPRSA